VSQGCLVGEATSCGLDYWGLIDSSGRRFSPSCSDWLWGLPCLLSNGYCWWISSYEVDRWSWM